MNEIKQLTRIYHETQEGALCAQHALNNLLQREIFSAISLADIARELDEQETRVLGQRLAESQNMDDTGFFSIQVLQKALEVFDIELIPYASQHLLAQQAREDPKTIQAYICNLREHWLTIRRFGTQYFDLNSISTVPKFISNTYLSLYLAQLQQSGYSIFIIHGNLSLCEADKQLTNNPIDPTYYRNLTERVDIIKNDNSNNKKSKNSQGITTTTTSFDDTELQRAIKASVELDNSEDKALQQVLAQSLRDAPFINHHEDETEVFNQRLLDEAIAASLTNDTSITKNDDTTSESVPTKTAEPTVEELRQRRLQFYDNKEKLTKEDQSSESDK